MPDVLRFGISSLDELFGVPAEKSGENIVPGIYLRLPDEARSTDDENKGFITTSVCIIGPTGTGKSIFGLHMASTYLADCKAENEARATSKRKRIAHNLPTVLYVSTDLSYKMAARAWDNFALNYPLSRHEPFVRRLNKNKQVELPLPLVECNPTTLAADFELIERETGHVIFVDMAAYTAGDDWGFLHKLLSLLPVPNEGDPNHLIVIDAIEGFEALAGEVNAFGEKSTRRSRIAQVMRLLSGKCHVLLVLEQGKGSDYHETLAEEFVVDTLIRLNSVSTRNYERRVLKVEKCRGQSHIRGQHHYSIRSGKGSTTGHQENQDDPKLLPLKRTKHDHDASQSYVQVFHSVHRISRKIMEDKLKQQERSAKPHASHYAAFGIKYLDNMLGGRVEVTDQGKKKGFRYDTRGLPCGSTTALIGDSLTQKSTLGKAFLSRCFYSFDKHLSLLRTQLLDRNRNTDEVLWKKISGKVRLASGPPFPSDKEVGCLNLLKKQKFRELVKELELISGKNSIVSNSRASDEVLLTELASWMLGYSGGVAVMFVTHNTDFDLLATEFIRWLYSKSELEKLKDEMPGFDVALKNHIKGGTICRRLEIHNLSSEVLVHIVKRAIYAAQRKFISVDDLESSVKRYNCSWPVRVVIDDFSILRTIFPELHEDPLLFPSILFHLEQIGRAHV